jgi:D-xylose 1-dehydrogenase (NADP+, D-xylono-1,5-lactone-forming)
MSSRRKVRFGILSTAKIGREKVIPALQDSGLAEPVLIGSRDDAKARETALHLGIPRSCGSYEAVVNDPEVDAVYIPAPNNLHAEWTIRAAEAGKHVLCEKPLAMNLSEAREMRRVCRERGVLLMDAFMYRHHPQQARAKELVDSGMIGEAKVVKADFTFNLGAKPEENIRLRPETGGGALMDVGCYCVNVSRFIFGEEPRRVSGHGDFTEGLGVDTQFFGMLEYDGGRAALFNSSFRQAFQNAYAVVGTEGILTVLTSFVPGPGNVTLRLEKGGEVTEEIIPGTHQYTCEVDHFCRAVLDGAPMGPRAEDGVANMAVLDALYRSAREGRTVDVEQM